MFCAATDWITRPRALLLARPGQRRRVLEHQRVHAARSSPGSSGDQATSAGLARSERAGRPIGAAQAAAGRAPRTEVFSYRSLHRRGARVVRRERRLGGRERQHRPGELRDRRAGRRGLHCGGRCGACRAGQECLRTGETPRPPCRGGPGTRLLRVRQCSAVDSSRAACPLPGAHRRRRLGRASWQRHGNRIHRGSLGTSPCRSTKTAVIRPTRET